MPDIAFHAGLKKTSGSAVIKLRASRSMSQWDAPVLCPSCSPPAARRAAAAMLAVPASRDCGAGERNELNAHEPRMVRHEHLPQDHRGHRHDHSLSPLIKQKFSDVRKSPPEPHGRWAVKAMVRLNRGVLSGTADAGTTINHPAERALSLGRTWH
jgi:hypothetical protein